MVIKKFFFALFFISTLLTFAIVTEVFAQDIPDPQDMVTPSPTQPLPRVEAGLGAGFFQLPDYPGANESSIRFLPLPYLIYRGDVIRSDRDGGVRGRFFTRDRMEIDLSLGAAFPVSSADNQAREGMPELDGMGEIGPRFVYHLIKTPKNNLLFYFPIRYAVSTDWKDVKFRGYTIAPEFVFRKRSLIHKKMHTGVSVSFNWATEELMDYFYQVDSQYATAQRNQYDAKAGYLMTNASIFSSYVPNNKWLMFGALSLNYYRDAKNNSSPLLLDNATQSYIFGVVWKFYESKTEASTEVLKSAHIHGN